MEERPGHIIGTISLGMTEPAPDPPIMITRRRKMTRDCYDTTTLPKSTHKSKKLLRFLQSAHPGHSSGRNRICVHKEDIITGQG